MQNAYNKSLVRSNHLPARVPAVLDMPIKMPAYLGAMSMWFTENPPLANPAKASTLVIAVTPAGTPFAPGRNMTEIALPRKPAALPVCVQIPAQIQPLHWDARLLSVLFKLGQHGHKTHPAAFLILVKYVVTCQLSSKASSDNGTISMQWHRCICISGTDANAALGTESDSLVGDSNVNGQTVGALREFT